MKHALSHLWRASNHQPPERADEGLVQAQEGLERGKKECCTFVEIVPV